MNKSLITLALLSAFFAATLAACTKCNRDCANFASSFCHDSTDGCQYCTSIPDPYNPGTRCASKFTKCFVQCGGGSGSCFNDCMAIADPVNPGGCNLCGVRCSVNADCAEASSCTRCVNFYPGFSVCST